MTAIDRTLTGLSAAVFAALMLTPAPAIAQSAEPGATMGPPGGLNLMVTTPRRKRCGETGEDGEIVVCGKDTGEDVRVPGDTDSKDALNTGIPSAPNVSGLPDCRKGGCIGFGKVPPPVYMIDLKAIPEAPKGSEADKVANGEMRDR